MKKIILTLALCAALALRAGAVYPVYDAPLHIQTLGDQIANYAKATAAYIKQTQQYIVEHTTALKEIQQVENEIVQLERMGDPKAYGMSLPGVGVITGLAQIYQQGKQDAEDWASFANPQAAKVTAEQIMGLYNQSLTGMTTSGGFHVPPAQGLIQFSTSNYNVASGAQDSITKMIATKTDLTQARDTAIAQMKAASDQSEVQKDQAIISSLNGAIAGVDASIQQAVQTANLQMQKNNAAEQVYKAGVVVQSASGFSGEVASSMDGLAKVAPNDATVPQWQP
jgi:hypothetical protein